MSLELQDCHSWLRRTQPPVMGFRSEVGPLGRSVAGTWPDTCARHPRVTLLRVARRCLRRGVPCTRLGFVRGAGGSLLRQHSRLLPRLTDFAICRQSSAVRSRVEKTAVLLLVVTEFTSPATFSRSLFSHFLGKKGIFFIIITRPNEQIIFLINLYK